MSDVLVRDYQEGDLEGAARVMRVAFNSVDQGWSEEGALEYMKDVSSYVCRLVAVQGGEIVGLLVAKKEDKSFVVGAIGVDPEQMGRGIGRSLYETAMERAGALGCTSVRMVADPKSAAYKWYMKLGFEANGWVEVERKL